MTQEQVNTLLREYRALVGRCGHIDAEIQRLRRAICAARAQFAADLAAPSVSRLDGMPPGGQPGSPTERAGLELADGRAFENSDAGLEVRHMEAEIARLEAEREERQLRVRYVESWLNGLPDRERWVIERHLIDGEIWHDIIQQFNARFSDDISRDRLKRLQTRALERIYAMAG